MKLIEIYNSQKVKYNRLVLLVFMSLAIIFGFRYLIFNLTNKINYYKKVNLYFSDYTYSKLYLEERKIKKIYPEEDKTNYIRYTLNLLIQGPIQNNLRALLSINTKLRSVWYVSETRELHVNFSKELITDINSNIKNDLILIYSITYCIFNSFPEVDKIRIYLENEPLKTITGRYDLNHFYNRNNVKNY